MAMRLRVKNHVIEIDFLTIRVLKLIDDNGQENRNDPDAEIIL